MLRDYIRVILTFEDDVKNYSGMQLAVCSVKSQAGIKLFVNLMTPLDPERYNMIPLNWTLTRGPAFDDLPAPLQRLYANHVLQTVSRVHSSLAHEERYETTFSTYGKPSKLFVTTI